MIKILLLLFITITLPAWAGPGPAGHSHDTAAVTTGTGTAAPRFGATTDLFEVVGILAGGALAVFIDRFATNVPVIDATVELESGTFKAKGVLHKDLGHFVFPAYVFNKPGSHPLVLTITAGEDVDIVAANLVVPDPHAGDNHADAPWRNKRNALLAGVALLLLAMAAIGWRLKSRAQNKYGSIGGSHV